MLVDCGLFQGLKELRERNWQRPADRGRRHRRGRPDARAPRSLRLSAAARRRRASAAASSARRARRTSAASSCPTPAASRKKTRANANRHGYSKHAPALPLYTEADAFRALTQLQPVGYDRPVPVAAGVEVEFINAGHLLGSVVRARAHRRARRSCSAATSAASAGRSCPIPTMVDEADFLLVESTYGDRVHEHDDDGEQLARDRQATVGARRQG